MTHTTQPQPTPAGRPWHTRTGWIVLLLVVFAPVGILLLYRAGIWQATRRHIVSAVAAVWFVVLLVAGTSGGSDDKDADTPSAPAAVVSTTPTTPAGSAPPTTPTPQDKSSAPTGTSPRTTEPAVPATTKPSPATSRPAAVSYRNCAQVKAAGAAPIHRGDPGYGPHLDKDGDGTACES
ncbi:hypothetical protein B4N89_36070 [Embleya scabrispora]|uniref:Excalibur calcium-binding domain-containing protein n=1 Tax=Embleya scabrispora TaxID=159449 RepID=A0A1T3NLR1_9ACTN|nr:excalibur calcium-binding domain-containing protein [Embleya scabrispora]OPC77714.1 hypothetical protein B4N89_36070 [Embleya scabrispora]